MGKYDEYDANDAENLIERDKDGGMKADGKEGEIIAVGIAVAACIYAWFKGKGNKN